MILGRDADDETLDQSEIRVWLDMSSKFPRVHPPVIAHIKLEGHSQYESVEKNAIFLNLLYRRNRLPDTLLIATCAIRVIVVQYYTALIYIGL